MTPEQFCYWLQGFGELQGTSPSPEQWQMIQDHLKTVFTKITPEYPRVDWNPLPSPTVPASPDLPGWPKTLYTVYC